jgi:uncharacterized protein
MVASEVMSPCCSERSSRVPTELFSSDFQPLDASDRSVLEPWLRDNPQPLAGYTFAGLYGWAEVFCYEWKRLSSGALLVSCVFEPDRGRDLIQPLGRMSPEEQRALLAAARRLDYPLRIHGVGEVFLRDHPALAEGFEVVEDRGRSDYIYNAEDLAFLKGRTYARKRNHVSQAESAHRWTTEPLEAANVDTCRRIAEGAREDLGDADNLSFKQENQALSRTLGHAQELGQQGVVVFADGNPAAFSLFEAQGPDVAVIHFERGIRAFKGAFQIVNREAARVLVQQGFKRINREDDLGLEGLRKAKLSYYPVELAKSFMLTLKR